MAPWTARRLPHALVLLVLAILSTHTLALDVSDDAVDNVARRSPVLGVPLQRRNPRRHLTEDEYGAWAQRQVEYLRAKYGGTSSEDKRAIGTAGLANQNTDSTFYASVGFGTPLEQYNLILDTGSADTWIAGADCTTGCDGVKRFAANASSTFRDQNRPFTVHYGSASARGSLGRDVVQMAGFEVQDQLFALVESVTSNKPLLHSPVSGLMGLAFRGIAASGGMPFWLRLANGGVFDRPMMSFCLTRFLDVDGASALEPGGYFTLGGVNSSLYSGDIDFVPLPDEGQTYWELPLKTFSVNGATIPLANDSTSDAAIDTGTTLIGAPTAIIDQMMTHIPGSFSGQDEYEAYFMYPCNSSVQVQFSFGSRLWTVGPRDFKLIEFSNGTCVSSFFRLSPGSSSPKWIIGDTFLKTVYSVFQYDPPAIGFATLSKTALELSTVGGELPRPSQGASVVITGASSPRIAHPVLSSLFGLSFFIFYILLTL
ncbi:related to cathepsin d (lysosomal aspartyl protease) [Serendipita indica DSM 11827]|uniref:Related to cathepsin d (Lysosomal aspartyl protease) n=1 Tax=Serendipita indica (strain DSM 11827) TaxID=1109443 RepID=G4TA66_SERID|nr:related to cathepsin d (lysosomal aspartyl protease) [Serendipita indica DSM 11827]